MSDGNSSMKDHLSGPILLLRASCITAPATVQRPSKAEAGGHTLRQSWPVALWGAVSELGRAAMPCCDWQAEFRQREEIPFNHCFHRGLPNWPWANCISISCLSSPPWPKAALEAFSKLKTTRRNHSGCLCDSRRSRIWDRWNQRIKSEIPYTCRQRGPDPMHHRKCHL